MVASAAVAVGAGAIYSANKQSSAIKNASRTQQHSTDQSIQFQRDALDQQRNDLSRFRNLADFGVLRQFRNEATQPVDYSFNAANDPLLNNALNRTTQAVMNAQAAKGKLGSGDTLVNLGQALSGVAMDRQNQVFNEKYNAQNQQFNQLAQLIGTGQNAAAGMGAATANGTNNITNMLANNANAQGAAGIAQANNQSNMLNGLLGAGALYYGLSR